MSVRLTVGLPIRRRGADPAFADPGFIADAAALAEERGFWGFTAPDHVVAPDRWAASGGGEEWFDPFVLLAFAAARTTRIRLITHVLVLPYRHPLAVAKAAVSLDRLSGGRLVLGVGCGYLEEEFTLLGVPYAERGPRTDEGLEVVLACFREERPVVHGRFWRIEGAAVAPRPAQTRPPVWIGGNSMRAVRRTVERGDCWTPYEADPERIRAGLAHAAALGRMIEAAAPLGRIEREARPGGGNVAGDGVGPRARAYLDAGATVLKCAFGGGAPAAWQANLEWFAGEIAPALEAPAGP